MFKKLAKIVLASVVSFSMIGLQATEVVAEGNQGFSNPEFIELLDQIIESETKYGLTGVQLAVYKDGELIKNSAYGSTNNYYNVYDANGNSILDQAKALPLDERIPVTPYTLFDMASNTKMYATVFAMQKLASEGKIELNKLIKDIYPEFTDVGNENGWKDVITVQYVLSHYAGFAPDPQYHNNHYDKDDGIPNGKNDLYSQDKETTFEMIMKTPVTTEPGTAWAYSDVDMMLAGFIVEDITGKDLDTYVKEVFYTPLGLDKITFNPLKFGFEKNQISSSELHGNTRDGRIEFNNVRTEIVTGEVHDEKAFYSMDGVSGHAGLFGTAQQVAYLAQAMFDGTLDGKTFFEQATIDEFVTPQANTTQTAGGWRRKSETGGAAGWFSKYSPAGTIGHTGWTGTNTMIDTDNKLTLALFTNSRNTPIMGPGANDFYTKNSNISSYGAVSEFIYRGLGFGTETVDEVLEAMVLAEIPADFATVAKAKRNVVRSLIDVVELRATTKRSTAASDLLANPKVQNAIEELKKYEAEDLKFLTVTKDLDELLESAKAKDLSGYTTVTKKDVEDAIEEIDGLLSGDYTQEMIDDAILKLQEALDNLEVIPASGVDKSELLALINELSTLDKDKYTLESYAAFKAVLDEAQTLFDKDDATQDEVDAMILKLEEASTKLELKKDEPIEEKPEEKEETTKPTTPSTGISNNSLGYIISAGLGFALLLTVVLKRRKQRI